MIETAASVPAVGLRRVESVMGTMVSVDVRDPVVPGDAVEAVFDQLSDIDARFSPKRADSEVSRLARGEIDEARCSLDLRYVLVACGRLAELTDGAFDARHHAPEGRLDPSGFVRAWAIEEAAWIIDSAGGRNYRIDAGGDVIARGQAAPGRPWRVAIDHHDLGHGAAAVLAVSDEAIATSGASGRGGRIVDPRTGQPPTELASVTVVGPALGFTHAYAMAIHVMGLDGLHWLDSHPDHAAFAITADGRAVWTAGMERHLVR